MVRISVGTLLEISNKKRPVDDIPRVLAAKDQQEVCTTALASGSYLQRAFYEEVPKKYRLDLKKDWLFEQNDANQYTYVCPRQAPETCRLSNRRKTKEFKVCTTLLVKTSDIRRKWYIINVTDVSLGRLSTAVASILRGKNKPQYTLNVDTGDYIIVVNTGKLKLTGRKATDKIYYHHSDYRGGLRVTPVDELLAKNPVRLVELSVKGTSPKSTLGHQEFMKMHVYAGEDHERAAQKPEKLDTNELIQEALNNGITSSLRWNWSS